MAIRGAGGTPGGVGHFFLGLAMMIGGAFLFLSSVHVTNVFSFDYPLFRYGPVRLTNGVLLLPFCLGVAMVFFNAKSLLGWLLTLGSLAAICVGLIVSVRFSFVGMTLLDLLSILLLMAGGAGLFFGSLRSARS